MNEIACRERLVELLTAHNARIGAANEFLLGVKDAIAENDLAKLQQSLGNPAFAIEDIEQLEQQRHQVLAAYGFSQDSGGFEKCVAWCDDDAEQVAKAYQLLIENLISLQHSIQLNSLLINKGKDRVRRSIGILTGLGSGAGSKTYSSSGQAEQPAGQRDIAIA